MLSVSGDLCAAGGARQAEQVRDAIQAAEPPVRQLKARIALLQGYRSGVADFCYAYN